MDALRDGDIRSALISKLREDYSKDPNTIILQEFGLSEHRARIDLAVVNGSMVGFEIKSDADTLERLPVQEIVYSKIFDEVTVVIGESQINKIEQSIPKWWGILVARRTDVGVGFSVFRERRKNDNVDKDTLVQCLWKREVIEILKSRHLYNKHLENSKRSLAWSALSNEISLRELKRLVCECLKQRQGWSIVLPQESDGDLPRLTPIL